VKVRDAMTAGVLTITPTRTLLEAARVMAERNVGALVVIDPEQPGPGIITERDVIRALSAQRDPTRELVQDHLTANAILAGCDWSLEEAAQTMTNGGFRHLLVIEEGRLEGIISMRDIVRVWRPTRVAETATAA
jgi:CBS domain-containing protein